MKNLYKYIALSILVTPVIFVVVANYLIEQNAQDKTFTDSSIIGKNKVGLVLGTAKKLKNGNINLYFKYRIDATADLYKKGKIDFVLVSGDNGNKDYDEPTDFKNELIKNGIPENKIFLDYAGFRTLDSVVRAKEVFGQESITFISQEFHNERAIFLAERSGINAIGFNAKDLPGKYGIKTQIREYFARAKVFLDLLLRVQPKFLGEKIEINDKEIRATML
ncbi:YdcF family protein [Belliella sp. R4-6]|uniref:YdcF family protein n=1 Tax=Belliella alkalica TaxID=1730871 RepID=A0ABS9VDL6_9BACT|nr:ElyC/SanA/YdcF family protein [Belliella alkalica]MCH7414527.1 YdcF family protein [Belliella alkalica]